LEINKEDDPTDCKPSQKSSHTEKTQTDSQLNPLSNLSPEESKRLRVLKLEYDVFFSTGVRVPDAVSDDEWLKVLRDLPTYHARKRYYSYLFKNEKSRANSKMKSARNIELQEEKRQRVREEIETGEKLPFKNAFLMFLQENTMNKFYYGNMCRAMLRGPHLVFDFGFEEVMSEQELKSLITQMQLSHNMNKMSREPFHFHFCNVCPGSRTFSYLEGSFPNLATVPISVTDKHYTEFYPKERLVYLSPNAPTVMTSFDEDDVYIIGAIVDKAKEDPLTLARAKKEKIRTMRFPLDKYLRWVQGSKSLTLNHVVKILLDFKTSNNWKESLCNSIPPKKHSTD
jgi:ribonuclease P protein 1